MKSSFAVLSFVLLGGIIASPVVGMAKSLITIQEFPKTYADVPFAQRIENEDMGYDAWDSVYDENGICISGCAYYGIRLQDELKMMADAGEQLARDLAADGPSKETQTLPGGTTPGQPSTIPTKPSTPPSAPSTSTRPTGGVSATNNFTSPIDTDICISSLIGLRTEPTTSGGKGSRLHKGIDISVSSGTDVFAAYDGTVVTAAYQGNGAGYYIKLEHVINGAVYHTYYMHMTPDSFKVQVDDEVKKGELLGLSGNSGKSSGPHLHYEIRTSGGISIDPLGSCILAETMNIASDQVSKLEEKHKTQLQDMIDQSKNRTSFLGDKQYKIQSDVSSPVFKYYATPPMTPESCFPNYVGVCY